MARNALFAPLNLLGQLSGMLSVLLTAMWMGDYGGGFGWGFQEPLKFNHHPLFMVIGLVFLYGDAILVYRVFHSESKMLLKLIHMFTQLSAFGFAVFALYAVFSAHNDEGYPNLYSLHSWVGLITVILFGAQFVLGFMFYLFPKLTESLRAAYMPLHRYWGVAIFCMAIATALMGVVENAGFKTKNYSGRTGEAYVINFLGLSLVVFGWTVTYMVTKDDWKRQPSPSDYSDTVGLLR